MAHTKSNRVSALMVQSDKISKSCDFYNRRLTSLRDAWYADADNAKCESRYKRLSARWKRESSRLIAQSDALLAK